MAVLGRANMSKARRIQSKYSQERKEAREKEKEWSEKHKETPEERKAKEDYILGVLGLKKENGDNKTS